MPFWRRRHDQNPGLSRSESARATSSPINVGRQELPDNSVSAPPRADLTYARRGDEYFNQGNYVNSIFMYNEALILSPNNPLLNMQLALCKTMIVPPQLSEALLNVNAVLQLDPANGSAWKLKGEIHDMQNDHRSAEDALVNAIGFLQGYARVQAQQSLASVRMRNLSISSSSASPISGQSSVSQPLEMPSTTERQQNVPDPPAAPNIVISNAASLQPSSPPAVSAQETTAPTQQASTPTANPTLPNAQISPPAAAASLCMYNSTKCGVANKYSAYQPCHSATTFDTKYAHSRSSIGTRARYPNRGTSILHCYTSNPTGSSSRGKYHDSADCRSPGSIDLKTTRISLSPALQGSESN